MSGKGKTTVVPVDVVSGIVQQLSEVSQHTTSAPNAMNHLVAEIAQLRELMSMDATTVAKALAAAGSRSVSPGAVDNVTGRSWTTDPALRKLQEKDPDFPKYDSNPEHFLPWFVAYIFLLLLLSFLLFLFFFFFFLLLLLHQYTKLALTLELFIISICYTLLC